MANAIVDARPSVAGRVEGARMHVDRRLLGWGLFFILVGGIPLAVRTNLLSASVVGQWANLWPLVLIGWGVGLLLRSTPIDWIGGALTAITFGIMGGGFLATGWSALPFATGCSSSGPTTAFEGRTGDLGQTAQVDIDFNCGSLGVGVGEGSTWNVTGSDGDGRGPNITSSSSQVSIKRDDSSGFAGPRRFDWNIT